MKKLLKILVFGNCQKSGIKLILEKTLPEDKYEISFCSNTPKIGGFLPNDQLEDEFKKTDILIYQPIESNHYFNEERMSLYSCEKIKFPYIFNSGISSLGYAPMASKNAYGEVFGEDILLELFQEHSFEEVLSMYQENQIDFNLLSRFNYCLNEMRIREKNCDIKLTPYIEKNYKNDYLFITHNHPSFLIFQEINRQVCVLLGESELSFYENWLNCFGYSYTGSPVSPYDVQQHGYKFGYHKDWYDRGKRLIEMVFFYHKKNKLIKQDNDRIFTQAFPDSNFEAEELSKAGKMISSKRESISLFESSYLISILLNEMEIAIESVENLKELNISYPDFYLNLAKLLMKSNDLAGAEVALKRSIELDPKMPMAYFQLSRIYSRKNEIDKALEEIRNAIHFKIENPIFYLHLGSLLIKKGDLDGAEKASKRSIELDPKVSITYFQLSQIYSRKNEVDKAVEEINKAINLKEDIADFHLHLSQLLIRKKDFINA